MILIVYDRTKSSSGPVRWLVMQPFGLTLDVVVYLAGAHTFRRVPVARKCIRTHVSSQATKHKVFHFFELGSVQ